MGGCLGGMHTNVYARRKLNYWLCKHEEYDFDNTQELMAWLGCVRGGASMENYLYMMLKIAWLGIVRGGASKYIEI